MDKNKVAVLFALKDSIYKTIPGCDVYDVKRNALTFPGRLPVVAHPPCRAWGRLRGLANIIEEEKDLARWALSQVRQWGGVLEHPECSTLWLEQSLPFGTQRDEFGGFTLSVDQHWFGHRARKRTWLYVCGCQPQEIPAYSMKFEPVEFWVKHFNKRKIQKPVITDKERSATPPDFAKWLIELAIKCQK